MSETDQAARERIMGHTLSECRERRNEAYRKLQSTKSWDIRREFDDWDAKERFIRIGH